MNISENTKYFCVGGYHYNKTPRWFDKNKNEIIPVKYDFYFPKLNFNFYFYDNPNEKKYFLETSEYVCPLVTLNEKKVSGIKLRNDIEDNGNYIWEINI